MKFYALSVKKVISELKSSEKGLSETEVKKRLKLGKNILKEEGKVHPLALFVRQFTDLLNILLIIAAIISFALGEILDGSAMVSIVILSAILGFSQEYKAEKAVQALKKMSALTAKVIRNGKEYRVPACDLVKGDIIILEEGDIVPADARIIKTQRLEVNESSLTGESSASNKTTSPLKINCPISDRDNMIFSGTSISYGNGTAIITSIGMNTEIGKIASTLNERSEKTPLQKKFTILAKQITFAILILIFLVFLLQLFFYESTLTHILIFSLSLAVAAIPSSLPAIATIGLSIGAKKLAKNNMIVKNLTSTESLGSATIICSDKTGTLTKNEMTITNIFCNNTGSSVSGTGYSPEGTVYDKDSLRKLFEIGVMCNNAVYVQNKGSWEIMGDPTEGSLLVLAKKAGIEKQALQKIIPVIDELPFDSDRKMMSVIVKSKRLEVYTKGAPDLLLKKCTHILINNKRMILTSSLRNRILNQNKDYAEQALRVLGLAFSEIPKKYDLKNIENKLTFVGLVGMTDPPREEIKDSLKQCADAGIKVMIITGDHALTTKAIGEQIGLFKKGDLILTGSEMDKLSDIKLKKIISKIRIIARALPVQKKRIVEILKSQNHVVAMTGDGVNDAPALKKADIGIAMGSGTDVSKEVAKAVLVDNNFATIVKAIAEGRNVYDKIMKAVRYLLSCNFAEILTVFFALLLRLPLPLLPLQILLMNLLTDGLPAIALSTEPLSKQVMKNKPRSFEEKPLTKRTLVQIVTFGILMTIFTLGLFIYFGESQKAQTVAFTSLVIFEMVAVLSSRSKLSFVESIPINNKNLIFAIISSLVIQVSLLYVPFFQKLFLTVPLLISDWILIISSALFLFILMEMSKVFINRGEVR